MSEAHQPISRLPYVVAGGAAWTPTLGQSHDLIEATGSKRMNEQHTARTWNAQIVFQAPAGVKTFLLLFSPGTIKCVTGSRCRQGRQNKAEGEESLEQVVTTCTLEPPPSPHDPPPPKKSCYTASGTEDPLDLKISLLIVILFIQLFFFFSVKHQQ